MQPAQTSAHPTYSLADIRHAFKRIGYRVKSKMYSEFIGAKIIAPNGVEINSGNVFTPSFLAEHKLAFDLRNRFRGKVFDGNMRVVL